MCSILLDLDWYVRNIQLDRVQWRSCGSQMLQIRYRVKILQTICKWEVWGGGVGFLEPGSSPPRTCEASDPHPIMAFGFFAPLTNRGNIWDHYPSWIKHTWWIVRVTMVHETYICISYSWWGYEPTYIPTCSTWSLVVCNEKPLEYGWIIFIQWSSFGTPAWYLMSKPPWLCITV